MAKQDLPKDYIISGVSVFENKLLGEGAYGVVQLGKYYGLLCAVKKLKSSMFPAGMKQLDQQTEIILQSFYNECDKLSKIRHPNVVQLLGVYDDRKTRLPVIVMELMYESLTKLLYRTKSLSLCAEVNVCHDVAQALAYLHSFRPPIVHRDLSSNNILLSEHMKAKITDLGVAKVAKGSFLNWDHTPAPGTMAYMPPEVRKVPADLTPAMDIFALGVNAIQIKTHKFPRPGPEFISGRLGFSKMVPEKERRRDHLELIAKSHPLKLLAIDCLLDNPRDRPGALQICERLEKVKETRLYTDSIQSGHIKDTQANEIRQQVSGLEQTVAQLQEELTDKAAQLERIRKELDEEREYIARILEERTRENLRHDIGRSAVSVNVDTTETRKKKRPLFQLKRLRSFRKGHSSNGAIPAMSDTSTSDGCVSPEAELRPANDDILQSNTTTQSGNVKHSPKAKKHRSIKKSTNKERNAVESDQTLNPDEFIEGDESERAKRQFKVTKISWYSHNCLPQGLQGSTLHAHVLGDKLLLCGGATSDGLPNKALYYCPARNITRWMRAHQDVPQYYCASAIVQGELVLISGLSALDGKCTGSLMSYNLKSRIWYQQYPSIPTPRSSADAFVFGEYLVVIGGQNDDGEALDVVEVLHIPAQIWETAKPLPSKVAGQSVTVCGDTVYITGGSDGSIFLQSLYCASASKILSSCNRLPVMPGNSKTIWRELHDLPFIKMTTMCSGNQLLAFGGEEVTKSANSHPAEWIWLYNLTENTWTPVQRMPTPRKLCTVTVLPDNNIIIIGGEPDYNRVDIAEIL